MKPRAVIVGAGLAGSILAARLRARYAVTVIDLSGRPRPLPTPVIEEGTPLRLDIHAGAGPGGSTSYWHNGLIEQEDADYAGWPVTKSELAPYLAQSLKLLGGAEPEDILREDGIMRQRLVERGVPASLLGRSIFYPRRRRNIWNMLGLREADIEYVVGTARHFEISGEGRADAVMVETLAGPRRVAGDLFIASAGGLSSPVLLAETARSAGLPLPAIGRHYHDHPMCWMGQMTLGLKLYDVWNHTAPSLHGVLRMPFVIRTAAGKFAFYIRTQALGRHRAARSALTELRNNPWNLRNILEAIGNGGDVLEVLAFQFGINIPSQVFSILMIAEQAPDDTLSISAAQGSGVVRRWTLPPRFEADAEAALREMVAALANHVVDFTFQPGWSQQIHTASHHSGACRMASGAAGGVCGSDLGVFHVKNLYVCDGSVLPSSGYANTGLMIGALSLRLAARLLDGGSITQ